MPNRPNKNPPEEEVPVTPPITDETRNKKTKPVIIVTPDDKAPKRGDVGFIDLDTVLVQKAQGGNKGRASFNDIDDHALAYIIKGLNCRIDAYERLQASGPLADDDQTGFDYTKYLRDTFESIRNTTLEQQ
jgi:hypothetical protein